MLLPTSFPDELLFSRIVRFLIAAGGSAENFLEQVYGSKKASIHPFLTAGLVSIGELTKERAEKLLWEQTIAPLFISFMPLHSEEIVSAMFSSNNSAATRSSQLSCVRERESMSLKFCPDCASADMVGYGVCYWHLSHQIPGIESCSRHRIWLTHVDLPERTRVKVGLPPVSSEAQVSSLLSFELAKYATQRFQSLKAGEVVQCVEKYMYMLSAQGYITKGGSVRRRQLNSNFNQFTRQLCYPITSLLPKSEADYKYLSNLLHENASQHPFKHLLFSFWLMKMQDWAQTEKELFKQNFSIKKGLESRIRAQSTSKNPTAEESCKLGKSHFYVKSTELKENISNHLKSKKLTPRVKNRVVQLAEKGFHRKFIARQLDISTGSVEMLISATDGLVEWRKQCKHESRRRRYKLQIVRYRQQHSTAIRRDIKRDCNAAFFWLYIHEKEWLELALPKATKPFPRSKLGLRKILFPSLLDISDP